MRGWHRGGKKEEAVALIVRNGWRRMQTMHRFRDISRTILKNRRRRGRLLGPVRLQKASLATPCRRSRGDDPHAPRRDAAQPRPRGPRSTCGGRTMPRRGKWDKKNRRTDAGTVTRRTAESGGGGGGRNGTASAATYATCQDWGAGAGRVFPCFYLCCGARTLRPNPPDTPVSARLPGAPARVKDLG